MKEARDYIDGLAELHRLKTADARRAVWRQSMATLAAIASEHRPVPLEGLHPEPLLESVRVAFTTGLIDDLDWLSPPAAAAAIYELAASIPVGNERRELGRRVVTMLHEGNAATFVTLATSLAFGVRRGLQGAAIRARVALSLDLPIGAQTVADRLALALLSRAELAREWLVEPSTGSLPSRRLASRLLERAAREAARRARHGDESGVFVFKSDAVQAAWSALLGDRESLVWRHAATARGLLSDALPGLRHQIENDLDPKLSVTEWRRAAASLAATVAVSPEEAISGTQKLLASEIGKKDRGIAGAMIMALPTAAESEPDATEELLVTLVQSGGMLAAESLLDLRHERLGARFGARAAELARAGLRESLETEPNDDDGMTALLEAVEEELAPPEERAGATLRERLNDALFAFASAGPKEAHAKAMRALDAANMTLDELSRCTDDDDETRKRAFRALRELDMGLLETSMLHDLLVLGQKSGPDANLTPEAPTLDRLAAWILEREEKPCLEKQVAHPTLRLRRLRALLHLVDTDGGAEALGEKSAEYKARRVRVLRGLLVRATQDVSPVMKRTIVAALARACDGLLREEICELADVIVAVAMHVPVEADLRVLAEASMRLDMKTALLGYADWLGAMREVVEKRNAPEAALDALRDFARALPAAHSQRVEALRAAVAGIERALRGVLAARSQREVAAASPARILDELESSSHMLAQLIAGARRRLGLDQRGKPPAIGPAVRLLDLALERPGASSSNAARDALAACEAAFRQELPRAMADLASFVLPRVLELPHQAPRDTAVELPRASVAKEAPLPAWLPPNRIVGGFYVLRALGTGAVGSVFVGTRAEERSDPKAEKLALKVPEYDGAAARTLSETEFLALFRQEAGALLAIPQHANLAKFVTFDAGAKPKPVLVMELVEGPTLERVIAQGSLGVKDVFAWLDGIAAGLDAMHSVGVGHLDVKPSNVILAPTKGTGARPVLVDFGLAGRTIRPGCATGAYGAPEIWGLVPDGAQPSPMGADVYAFGCVAFEALTGRTLFDGTSEAAVMTSHLLHDGNPPPLTDLATHKGLQPLVDVLATALRKDPRERATIRDLRTRLADVAVGLSGNIWPLA